MDADDGDEPLIFNDVVIAPPASSSAMAGVSALLNLDQRCLNRQIWMRKNAGEINQLVEQIEQRGLLRAKSPRDFLPTPLRQPHKLLANHQRLHHQYLM